MIGRGKVSLHYRCPPLGPIMFDLPPNPVHGVFRAAVFGPAFMPGTQIAIPHHSPLKLSAPFTGLFRKNNWLVRVSPSPRRKRRVYYRCAASPVNGTEEPRHHQLVCPVVHGVPYMNRTEIQRPPTPFTGFSAQRYSARHLCRVTQPANPAPFPAKSSVPFTGLLDVRRASAQSMPNAPKRFGSSQLQREPP